MSDNHFIVGEKCRGYRFTENYLHDFILVEMNDSIFSTRLQKAEKEDLNKAKKSYGHIVKWFGNKLTIDADAALLWLRNHLDITDSMHKWGRLKRPIDRIVSGQYSISTGETLRLFSVMTSIKRQLRHFLKYDGKNLVEIDMSTCQPFLTIPVLKDEFWEKSKDRFTIYDVKTKSSSRLTQPDVLYKIRSEISYINSGELKEYCDWIYSGDFYEKLGEVFCKKLSKTEIKLIVFYIFYSSNLDKENKFLEEKVEGLKEKKECKKIFQDKFMTIASAFRVIKSEEYEDFARLLQAVEAHLVLFKVCKRISKEKPELPIFTIHDSIITIEGEQGYVQRIFEEEFIKAFGIKPEVKFELLTPETIKK